AKYSSSTWRYATSIGKNWQCRLPRRRQYQHRIAVREEPIAFRHGVPIGVENQLAPGERRNEHEQRRFRQMEIRDQRIDARDAVARKNEDLRLAGERSHFAVAARGFERAHDGGADRDDAPAGRTHAAHLLDELRADVEPLAVHRVALDVLAAQRLE